MKTANTVLALLLVLPNIIVNRPGLHFEVESWADGLSHNNIVVDTPVRDQPGLLVVDPLFRDAEHGNFMLAWDSPCIDAGDPDPVRNDPEDPGDPGHALVPALGTTRSDMGAYGGPHAAAWDVVTAVMSEPDERASLPASPALQTNYPNPFNPTTSIKYQLAEDARVQLRVYNALGQLVRTLVDGEQMAGRYSVVWDGRDHEGNAVSSGLYICTLRARDFTQSRKMMLIL